MYPIFRKPQSGRLPTTAEHPSQNNHIASQRSVTTSADDEGVESHEAPSQAQGRPPPSGRPLFLPCPSLAST
ncbi:hypothetical protein HaLaN_17927 [Haematococcus lacustris]|uniref:Uncharacterized protein n=1 Tax=Haematococcus lacustris TaxID=44745 RepID=A0A699ZDR4_HAELA|nr:hypothetical protein HaLaN_17927 [Haematococcus lacustris]